MTLFKRFNNKNILAFFLALFAVVMLALGCAPIKPGKAPGSQAVDFNLTLLHTNDVHSTYGGLTDKGQTCYAALCESGRGGYVRLDQAVRAIRRDQPAAVFMDAGDIFQGTLFWTVHKEVMPARLIDKMGYQAIIPGNHEFDEGWGTWLKLVNRLKTPVLAANVSFGAEIKSPALAKIKPYLVLEQGGRKIGLVGLVTPNTPETSSPGLGVSFAEAKEILEKAVQDLSGQGVGIIVAVTHLGLENERRLARAVSGVDVIVGAHSHSLLSNTENRAEGPYPIVEKAPNGAPVLVVSASTASIYLGRLEVGFDAAGVARKWQGGPIKLDEETLASLNAPQPDAALMKLIDGYAAPVAKMMKTRLGAIAADGRDGRPLEEPNVLECRKGECLTGNIVADALRTTAFKKAQIALINGGALRNSLPGGPVTPGDVLGTLPFQNTPLKADMPGEIIWQALERGVSTYGEGEGCFLQVSGLRYAFNPALKSGRRITKAEVMDENGQWGPLDKGASYQVVTIDFLARGGDGFSMFKNFKWEEGDKLANDVLRVYLEKHKQLKAGLEGRITVER